MSLSQTSGRLLGLWQRSDRLLGCPCAPTVWKPSGVVEEPWQPALPSAGQGGTRVPFNSCHAGEDWEAILDRGKCQQPAGAASPGAWWATSVSSRKIVNTVKESSACNFWINTQLVILWQNVVPTCVLILSRVTICSFFFVICYVYYSNYSIWNYSTKPLFAWSLKFTTRPSLVFLMGN